MVQTKRPEMQNHNLFRKNLLNSQLNVFKVYIFVYINHTTDDGLEACFPTFNIFTWLN